MNTVEDAYLAIAEALTNSIENGWTEIVFTTLILAKDCSSMNTTRFVNGIGESAGLGFKNGFLANDAAIYLRDDLLRTTGARIWGLTFTLYPTGKFKIEYDYNKPEGYEETDETIDAGAAIASLQNILAGGSDNKPK